MLIVAVRVGGLLVDDKGSVCGERREGGRESQWGLCLARSAQGGWRMHSHGRIRAPAIKAVVFSHISFSCRQQRVVCRRRCAV